MTIQDEAEPVVYTAVSGLAPLRRHSNKENPPNPAKASVVASGTTTISWGVPPACGISVALTVAPDVVYSPTVPRPPGLVWFKTKRLSPDTVMPNGTSNP